MTYMITNAYNNEMVHLAPSAEEALKWCEEQAIKLNDGMYRTWESPEGNTFCDAGPKTYIIKLVK